MKSYREACVWFVGSFVGSLFLFFCIIISPNVPFLSCCGGAAIDSAGCTCSSGGNTHEDEDEAGYCNNNFLHSNHLCLSPLLLLHSNHPCRLYLLCSIPDCHACCPCLLCKTRYRDGDDNDDHPRLVQDVFAWEGNRLSADLGLVRKAMAVEEVAVRAAQTEQAQQAMLGAQETTLGAQETMLGAR